MQGPATMDFEHWRELARSDPEGFERQRQAAIEAAINRAPEERRIRLQRLQWRIDQVRGRASNPLAACIAVSGMMWESLTGRHGLLAHLQDLDAQRADTDRRRARVIPLRPRRH